MRGMCWIVLVLLAGCAASRSQEADQPAEVFYGGGGLRYETVRPGEAVFDKFTVDLTLVELDAALAEKLLGISDPNDIAPRSYKTAMGEIAAVNACYGHGRVIARPSLWIRLKEEADLNMAWEVSYLQDWVGEEAQFSPVFNTYREGLAGKLKLFEAADGVSVVLDAASAHAAWPIASFETSVGAGSTVRIQIPEVSLVSRVATETIRDNETAMFQLSRAPFGDNEYIRLLFVRLR